MQQSSEVIAEGKGILFVLIPVLDDWESIALLIPLLDAALHNRGHQVDVLLVDDFSTVPPPDDLVEGRLETIRSVRILQLTRNLGHQRAIAAGLYHIQQHYQCRAVIVMDGDGEDRPEDVIRLVEMLDQNHDRKVVFAARAKRMESVVFRVFYHLYRWVHRVLTGVPVRVGNFSILPRHAIPHLMASSDLWNHYAAAIFRSGLPFCMIPLSRGTRLKGRSRMRFSGLLIHGLSAISVFGDVVGVRLLAAAAILVVGIISLMLVVGYVRVGTDLAVPGWATYVLLLLLVLCLQAVMLAAVFTFMIISARSTVSFIPLRDVQYFILGEKRLFPRQ
jgi:polyisoprenyl-phosphate glycosyltransferase